MSRSLARIKNLVSEIEEIQRQGQQGGRLAMERTSSLRPAPEAPKTPESIARVTQPVAPASAPISVAAEPLKDAFESLNSVIDFPSPEAPPISEKKVDSAGKIFMQLSSQIVLSLQMDNSDELVELKQTGDSIEIRFSDGKAVHLPLKTVA